MKVGRNDRKDPRLIRVLGRDGGFVERLPLHTAPCNRHHSFTTTRTTADSVIISCSWCGKRKK